MLDYMAVTDIDITQGLLTAAVLLGTFVGAVIASIKGYKLTKSKSKIETTSEFNLSHFVLKKFELIHEELYALSTINKDIDQLSEHLSQLALAIATLVELNRDRSVRVNTISDNIITIQSAINYIERDIQQIRDDIRGMSK